MGGWVETRHTRQCGRTWGVRLRPGPDKPPPSSSLTTLGALVDFHTKELSTLEISASCRFLAAV